jgi:hypothetical protein
LESVNYYQADKILEFTYSFPARIGRQFQEIRVPVPSKEKEQLQKVLKHFGIKPLEHLPADDDDDYDTFNEKFNSKTNNDLGEEGFEIKF